jgi:hypothetical protein
MLLPFLLFDLLQDTVDEANSLDGTDSDHVSPAQGLIDLILPVILLEWLLSGTACTGAIQ